MVIKLDYDPRWYQQEIHDALDTHRFAVLCMHRRAGKTVLAIMELIKRTIMCDKNNARGAYMAPLYKQAKQVAWTYVKEFLAPIPGVKFNEAELRVDIGDKRIQLLGADNYDALRGIYLDFVVMDEYADMPPAAWGTVIRPALADRKGRALFISTPKGHNNFYDLYKQAEEMDDWYSIMLPYQETSVLDSEEIEAMRRVMTPEEFQQEMECSWQAAIRGAYYGRDMALAHIENVPYDPTIKVITSWDLGIADSTVVWYWQVNGAEIRAIDCDEYQGIGLPEIIRAIDEKPYSYSQHIAPHDIQVRELGSGKTRHEIAYSLGIDFDVAPNQRIVEGIASLRAMIPRIWFDKTKCQRGIEALMQYRVDYDDKRQVFRNNPLHDWTSHFADSARYFAITSLVTERGDWSNFDTNHNDRAAI